ncbi:MAG TPA: GNAT family N-acetyltransferase [Geomonas sp.]
MSALHIETIQEEGELARLQPEWDALCASLADQSSVFMSSFWHDCWWRHFGTGAALNLIVVRRQGELIGLFPFMRRRTSLHGLPVRAICFPENGNSLHNDFLVRGEHRDEVLREVVSHLYRHRESWDVLQLNNMPEGSENCVGLLRLLSEGGRRFQRRPSLDSPYLEVSGDWERFLSSRPMRVRKTLRNIQNGMGRAGVHELLEVTTWPGYQEAREGLYEVARHSWTEQVGDSLAHPVNAAFFEDLARAASARGCLSLWLLKLNGTIAAFEFHLRSHATQHAMRASFHQEHARLSPGAFLEMQILKQIFEQPRGIGRVDFGGSFDPYKRRWSDSSRRHLTVTVFHEGLYSRIAAFHELGAVSALRTVRDQVRVVRGQLRGEKP